ncbi:septum formation protein Maf [bacterium]|nr:septum formation protein Maf [bacterium]
MMLLKKHPWTLASASPRRLSILRQVGIEPVVRPANVDELENGAEPESLCLANSHRKLAAIQPAAKTGFVLAADTMVILDGSSLGKPESEDHALELLRSLRGRDHKVLTSWVLHLRESNQTVDGVETTKVWMRDVSDDELKEYIATGHALDKAGAYGIQGAAGAFVERIEGCYFNVVGLPISRVMEAAGKLI